MSVNAGVAENTKESQLPRDDCASLWDRLRSVVESLATDVRSVPDPTAIAVKLANRSKLLRGRMERSAPAEIPLEFLAFNNGRDRFGIALRDVVSIQPLEHFSPVPQTPPFIAGVIHWRGAILSLLDLGALFELPPSGLADFHVCIVVEADGIRIGVIAREVENILSIPKGQVTEVPGSFGKSPLDWMTGVHDDNRLLLDMKRILRDAKLISWKKQ